MALLVNSFEDKLGSLDSYLIKKEDDFDFKFKKSLEELGLGIRVNFQSFSNWGDLREATNDRQYSQPKSNRLGYVPRINFYKSRSDPSTKICDKKLCKVSKPKYNLFTESRFEKKTWN